MVSSTCSALINFHSRAKKRLYLNTRLLSLRGRAKSDTLSERVVFWVTNYERQLLSIAYNVLRDWPAAEDCVQESLIKAGLRINQLKSTDSEFSWLSRIVVNQSKTMLRQRYNYIILLSRYGTIRHRFNEVQSSVS
ncbi:RNA polymerase sigma factor [Alicyclobacillus suci]|uniref:RNA polymerase sigma factor n=1 Tax=Alicyclobacillus suci TaxID=2816080 RepID=UPI0034DD7E08